jgi:hypothetical protein
LPSFKKAKSNPASKLLLQTTPLGSNGPELPVPLNGAIPTVLLIEYSLWNASPARLNMIGYQR